MALICMGSSVSDQCFPLSCLEQARGRVWLSGPEKPCPVCDGDHPGDQKDSGQGVSGCVRHNVAEWGLKDGISAEESIAFAALFEEAGADFVDISGYGYKSFLWGYWGEQLRALEPAAEVRSWLRTIDDPGFIIAQAARIKKAVSIPVIRGGE